MVQSSPMNGGDGINSYAKNSTLQRNAASVVEYVMKETLMKNLDIEKLLSGSTRFAIADFGCSVGPNTLFSVQTLIQTVEHKNPKSKNLEFHVFFNDQTANDFNTLFTSLPNQRNYFAAGVPGSFYGRLFPSSSIHIAYSSFAIHWLSKVPEALLVKDSPAWNAGKIHYTGASDAVVKAYADQFEAVVEIFLRARGEEIAEGGVLVILMPGVRDGVVEHGLGVTFTFLESILMDMGVVEQELVDSFNIPHVYPSVKEMRRVVEKNGSFEIVKMELWDERRPHTGADDIELESVIMHFRAFLEGMIATHFGNEMVDQLFARAIQHKLKYAQILKSSEAQIGRQIFAALNTTNNTGFADGLFRWQTA